MNAGKCIKTIGCFAVTFVVVVMACWALLLAAYSLPLDRIEAHVADSAPAFTESYPNPLSMSGSRIDAYTDALILLEACDSSSDSVIEASLLNPYAHSDRMNPDGVLYGLYAGDSAQQALSVTPLEYPQYWHGNLVILKPLLLFFNYHQILVLNMAFQLTLLVLLCALLCKRGKSILFLPVFAAYLFMNPAATLFCMQYASMVNLALLVLLLLVFFDHAFDKSPMALYLFFMVAGMLTCYFDFLTFPLVSLGIPIAFWLAYGRLSPRDSFVMLCLATLSWGIGYGGMWVAKWALGTIFTDLNVFAYGAYAFGTRTSGQAANGSAVSFFDVLSKNVRNCNKAILAILVICAIALAIVAAARCARSKPPLKQTALRALVIAVPALYPLAWYALASNHSFIHAWMTYRELSLIVFSLFAIIVLFLQETSPGKADTK